MLLCLNSFLKIPMTRKSRKRGRWRARKPSEQTGAARLPYGLVVKYKRREVWCNAVWYSTGWILMLQHLGYQIRLLGKETCAECLKCSCASILSQKTCKNKRGWEFTQEKVQWLKALSIRLSAHCMRVGWGPHPVQRQTGSLPWLCGLAAWLYMEMK